MQVSSKKIGLGIVALAVALMGSAAIADKAQHMGMHGKGGPMGRMGPSFDFAAADFEMPIFLAASVKPPWSTTMAKASISVSRSILHPLAAFRLVCPRGDRQFRQDRGTAATLPGYS